MLLGAQPYVRNGSGQRCKQPRSAPERRQLLLPSLMPGMPGAKEVYGVSVVRDDMTVMIPPRAAKRYEIGDDDVVVLAATHRGEAGFGLLNREKAMATVLSRDISQIEDMDAVRWVRGKAYAQARVIDGRVRLTPQMAEVFGLSTGDRLMVVKGARVAMAFTPVGIWTDRLARRGLHDAIERVAALEEF